jgi:DHA2 family methylenomycin A resistance protein-like MFS transporter
MVVGAAPEGGAGAAGGLLNAIRQVGATFGVAITGVFATTGQPGTGHGTAAVLVLCSGICATAAIGIRYRQE